MAVSFGRSLKQGKKTQKEVVRMVAETVKMARNWVWWYGLAVEEDVKKLQKKCF